MRDTQLVNVIIFERRFYDANLELPTCEYYFNDLISRIEVTFIDKSNPIDPGFILILSLRSTYDQMAMAVGHKLNVDPLELQFFNCLQ